MLIFLKCCIVGNPLRVFHRNVVKNRNLILKLNNNYEIQHRSFRLRISVFSHQIYQNTLGSQYPYQYCYRDPLHDSLISSDSNDTTDLHSYGYRCTHFSLNYVAKIKRKRKTYFWSPLLVLQHANKQCCKCYVWNFERKYRVEMWIQY